MGSETASHSVLITELASFASSEALIELLSPQSSCLITFLHEL